ncbi:hypothetical protein KC19_7G030700 [Ceratodon purpureus]|uniref:Magnesium transporter CorA-like family protein n=1 Tax=Ceratodon purpureus TaxID=3225 RepID=A0A8T0H437_CERPU|nr:hypothetical protein KC19_7G030700 [Ceratodon purpureus]
MIPAVVLGGRAYRFVDERWEPLAAMSNPRGTEWKDPVPHAGFHSPRVWSTGTLDLWRDGLICAYEFIPAPTKNFKVAGDFGNQAGPVQGRFDCEISVKHPHEFLGIDLNRSHDSLGGVSAVSRADSGADSLDTEVQGFVVRESLLGRNARGDAGPAGTASPRSSSSRGVRDQRWHGRRQQSSQWVPIGWPRLSELFQAVQGDPMWCHDDAASDDDESLTVADLAHPYWQKRAGPTFWCHVDARHPNVVKLLTNPCWLHPAVSVALRDEKRLISDRMKHLLYEVPVRVAGGLLFELTGHSIGDPNRDEEDVPVVFRSWHSQNFLITSMHVKGTVDHLNVLGVMEVQDLVGAGGPEAPKSTQEVIAQLASRLARWDDRMSRKHYFGAADEVELKYVNRKGNEDLALLSIILNREIRYLATQVIRIKWSLHARQEILQELMTHLKEENALKVLQKVEKQTREMLDEQDDVRDRLFTVQDVMQSNAREKLQQKSLRVQHNLAVIGGGGLLLSVIVGLFGINVDGIPGGDNNPYAFAIFSTVLFLIGAVVIVIGIRRLGLKKPPTEEEVVSRKEELDQFVTRFQKAAEAHEKVHHVASDPSMYGVDDKPQQPLGTDAPNDYYVLLH